MTTKEYAMYILEPFQNKGIILFATINAVIFGAIDSFIQFVELHLGISLGLFLIYFAMAIFDFGTGYYKNCIVKDMDFRSELFFKKIAQISIMTIALASITHLILWAGDADVHNSVVENIQGGIIYLFELMRVFVVVSFLAYELTSIKENADEIGWNTVSDVIDIVILPLTWIKDNLKKKVSE